MERTLSGLEIEMDECLCPPVDADGLQFIPHACPVHGRDKGGLRREDAPQVNMRQAIAQHVDAPSPWDDRIAVAILVAPEMRAIRRLLWALDDDIKAWRVDGYHYTDAYDEWHKIVAELPHVAEWARSDP